ncbi:MAG: type I restriction-modification system subunit M N-terminal domain-containing protein [Pegethrix bostrychoides GSE-TBD4-15B]|jgi:type I restriction-modification system DNA methylase subunit|uniref:Type I restriction-modification system subunit M N-terminal domain-containing protein n=1 Tax=Pegethrix bostrychoides GSE-TBD4-15B TaxID=2839662 RepID=A0A951U3S6_9CYAN|nr:type I restriction-modification system subunit M N-terminal domain-containing protein [Pegethrix bostrychoides GSE-TBD4-15B]
MVQGQLFNLTIDQSWLDMHLWEAANILRGSPVDRTDWKSCVLPLLFFKLICDVWNEKHEVMMAEYRVIFWMSTAFRSLKVATVGMYVYTSVLLMRIV